MVIIRVVVSKHYNLSWTIIGSRLKLWVIILYLVVARTDKERGKNKQNIIVISCVNNQP